MIQLSRYLLRVYRLRFIQVMLRLVALICMSVAMGAAMATEGASPDRNLEVGVKAAFLYKFAGYVSWPAVAFQQADTPITIGVVLAPAVAEELDRIVPGRRINDRAIVVKRLREGEPLAGVHILFIGSTERVRAATLIRSAETNPVLVVTEIDGGLSLGSGLNFVINGGRVRFEAAPESVEKVGLKLSSRLLSVALNTRGGLPQ